MSHRIIFNPEYAGGKGMIHIDPVPSCNVQIARRDPGPDPHHITGARMLELIRHFNADVCSRCVVDDTLEPHH